LKDATITVSPSLTGPGSVVQFSIGVGSLLNDGKTFDSMGLPDGRRLPDIIGGALPRWDFDVRGLNLSLYLSDDAFGLFVPLSFRGKKGSILPIMVSVKIIDDRGNLIGKAYAIPALKKSEISGLFILLPFLGGAPQSGTYPDNASHSLQTKETSYVK
jgi:hypothetical protein